MISACTTLSLWSARLGLTVCAVAILSGAAQAQSTTTRYVSTTGSNVNNCTRAAPCLTLQRGINKTPDGGELKILDSGTYADNPVTISKAITISADGVSATVRGVKIQTSEVVVLRGLLLSGAVPDLAGIAIGVEIVGSGGTVHILRCEVERFAIYGVYVDATTNANVFITDSVIRGNKFRGIGVTDNHPFTRLMVENTRFEKNVDAAIAVNGVNAMVTRSTFYRNGTAVAQTGGVTHIAWSAATENIFGAYSVEGGGEMTLESSIAHGNNLDGLSASGGSTARISNSVFTNNSTGVSKTGSTIFTRLNNTIHGNGNDFAGGLPTQFSPQ